MLAAERAVGTGTGWNGDAGSDAAAGSEWAAVEGADSDSASETEEVVVA